MPTMKLKYVVNYLAQHQTLGRLQYGRMVQKYLVAK